MHHHNTAELAIRSSSDQFVAGLFSTDPDLPMKNWDLCLEQAEITLNLLLHSILNPNLYAYSQLSSIFDFKRTPMDHKGAITTLQNKPFNRGTWAPPCQEGWYIHTEMLHYWCITQYIHKTAVESISDTADLLGGIVTPPKLSHNTQWNMNNQT